MPLWLSHYWLTRAFSNNEAAGLPSPTPLIVTTSLTISTALHPCALEPLSITRQSIYSHRPSLPNPQITILPRRNDLNLPLKVSRSFNENIASSAPPIPSEPFPNYYSVSRSLRIVTFYSRGYSSARCSFLESAGSKDVDFGRLFMRMG